MSLRPMPAPSVPEATVRVARAAFRKGCLAMRIRDELGPLFEDEQFARAFPCRGGPAWSPGQLAMVSVLQFAEGLTDRQAADAVRGRIDVKYALGLELDDPGFDFSVLSEFRGRLIAHGLEELVLDRLLERVGALGLLRARGRQRTDSTHVLAQVRTLNRMEFVGETLRSALETLAAAAPGWLRQIAVPEWFDRYGKRIDSFRFPKGADARKQWALAVGQDGFALLEAVYAPDAPDWLRHVGAVQVLRMAWVQQYHRDEDGKGVRWREGTDLPPGRLRLSSPYDTDTRYSVKRGAGWDGYKVHFTETCEPGAPHLITNVATTDATVPDVEITEPVHHALAARGLLPAVHLVDSGYTSAALLVAAAGQDIELMGPVFADTTTQGRAADGLGQDAFAVDWPAREVTCPRGQRSVSWSEQRKPTGTEIIRVHFAKTDCDACPVRDKCTSAKSKWGRSLTLLTQPQQQALDQRRREQETDEWKAAYGTRAGVEGTISQAVRVPKTHLGHVLTATGLNLHRLNTWWTGTPIGTTHISRFARLGLEPAA